MAHAGAVAIAALSAPTQSSGGTGTVADMAAGAMVPVGSMSQSMSTTSTVTGAMVPSAAPPGFPNFQTIEAGELVFQKAIGSGAYGSVFLADWTGCQVRAGRCGQAAWAGN